MANSVNPDQTAPIGAVCSGSTLFSSILNLSVMLGNYLQQTTSADDIYRCIFFLGALRVNVMAFFPHFIQIWRSFPQGGTLIFSHKRRLGSFFWFKILNFNIFLSFQKNEYFLGV